MNELEKMLAGQPYNSADPALLEARLKAKSLCHQFNQCDPTALDARMALLEGLIHFSGKAHIEPNFFCDYGFNIYIGDNFYSNHNLVILDVCRVDIGENVFLGPNVMLSTATHPIDPLERLNTELGAPITIGDNVWIGGNVSVMPNISIGENTVIGAGSVVTRNIPANCVAVGNPCRVIKPVAIKGV